jgi:hypothetical protein
MGWVVNATPWPFYSRERLGTHCTRGWVGPRAGLDGCIKSHSPPGFDPRTAQALAMPTALSTVVPCAYKYPVLLPVLLLWRSADSSVDMVTKLQVKKPRGRSSVSVGGKTYFLPHNAQAVSEVHPAFYSKGRRGIFRLGLNNPYLLSDERNAQYRPVSEAFTPTPCFSYLEGTAPLLLEHFNILWVISPVFQFNIFHYACKFVTVIMRSAMICTLHPIVCRW